MLAQLMTKIDGGPEWLNTDKYTIEAESEALCDDPSDGGRSDDAENCWKTDFS